MATNVVKDNDQEDNTTILPDEDTIKTLQRLSRAWKIVTDPQTKLLTKSKTHSLEEGEGMSIYRFLRPSRNSSGGQDTHNCEYMYAEKDSTPWLMMMNAYPKREEFFNTFKKESMYVICVSLPEHEFGDSTVQEIKIFSYVDDKEVAF